MMHCNQRYFILHSLTFSFNADSGTQNFNQFLAREQILYVIALGLLKFFPAKKEKNDPFPVDIPITYRTVLGGRGSWITPFQKLQTF